MFVSTIQIRFEIHVFLSFHSGNYLTQMIGVSGVMIFIQVILQRLYHKRVQAPLPAWAQSLNRISDACIATCNRRKKQVDNSSSAVKVESIGKCLFISRSYIADYCVIQYFRSDLQVIN